MASPKPTTSPPAVAPLKKAAPLALPERAEEALDRWKRHELTTADLLPLSAEVTKATTDATGAAHAELHRQLTALGHRLQEAIDPADCAAETEPVRQKSVAPAEASTPTAAPAEPVKGKHRKHPAHRVKVTAKT